MSWYVLTYISLKCMPCHMSLLGTPFLHYIEYSLCSLIVIPLGFSRSLLHISKYLTINISIIVIESITKNWYFENTHRNESNKIDMVYIRRKIRSKFTSIREQRENKVQGIHISQFQTLPISLIIYVSSLCFDDDKQTYKLMVFSLCEEIMT